MAEKRGRSMYRYKKKNVKVEEMANKVERSKRECPPERKYNYRMIE